MSQLFYPRGVTPRMDLKQLSPQWLEQSIRGPHAISSEEPPAVPYMPFKWLPAIQYFDTLSKMREGVCLLKGTIVSSVHMLESQLVNDAGAPTEGNQTAWSNNQTFPFVYDHSGVLISKQLEYTRDAYGPDIHSLLVPTTGQTIANHNTYTAAGTVRLLYSMNDVNMGRLLPDGTALTSSNYSGYYIDNTYKKPIGVVMDDIYVDYRGQFLNYQPEGKIVTNVYKQMEAVYPYVDVYAFHSYYELDGTHEFGDIKASLDAQWRYFWWSSAPGLGAPNGVDIIPDSVGNPTVDYTAYNTSVDTYIVHEQQTVGILDGLNSKQPHSLNDITDTPYGSGITGTDTAGVEAELFWFVHAALTLGGKVTPTAANILTAIRAGHFGWATLWINIK